MNKVITPFHKDHQDEKIYVVVARQNWLRKIYSFFLNNAGSYRMQFFYLAMLTVNELLLPFPMLFLTIPILLGYPRNKFRFLLPVIFVILVTHTASFFFYWDRIFFFNEYANIPLDLAEILQSKSIAFYQDPYLYWIYNLLLAFPENLINYFYAFAFKYNIALINEKGSKIDFFYTLPAFLFGKILLYSIFVFLVQKWQQTFKKFTERYFIPLTFLLVFYYFLTAILFLNY